MGGQWPPRRGEAIDAPSPGLSSPRPPTPGQSRGLPQIVVVTPVGRLVVSTGGDADVSGEMATGARDAVHQSHPQLPRVSHLLGDM